MERLRHTYAEINLKNLIHNYELIKNSLPEKSFLCPMVKANAYGHGEVEVSQALMQAGCQQIGVATIEEGVHLRQNQIECDILVFGIFDSHGAEWIVQHNLTPVLSTWQQIEALENAAEESIAVHLKFDTGMHRLGFSVEDSVKLAEKFSKNKKLRLVGVCTHLLHGEDALNNEGRSADQLNLFRQCVENFSAFDLKIHALNSSGALSWIKVQGEQNHFKNWNQNLGARPGIALYGSTAVLELKGTIPLKPVMTLKSEIVRFLIVPKGETVSYSGRWTAQQESLIGVIPIGYADGYHRLLSNKAEVLVHGLRAPVVGSVCMDYIMIDVTHVFSKTEQQKHLNAEVVLFGEDAKGNQLRASELARHAQTISYEIFTSVGARVPRVYKRH